MHPIYNTYTEKLGILYVAKFARPNRLPWSGLSIKNRRGDKLREH